MREKLVKARIINKSVPLWAEGLYLILDGKHVICYKGELESDIEGGVYENYAEIEPETICEYIGKINSKGEKLFEGDYCKNEDFDLLYLVAWNDLLCRFDIKVCANMEQAKNGDSINRVELNKGLGFVETSSFFPVGNLHDSME